MEELKFFCVGYTIGSVGIILFHAIARYFQQ